MSLPLPVPADEHDRRIAGLRAWMAEAGAHAFAAVSPENVYYLTGLDHLGYFAFTAVLIPATPDAAPVVVTREMERPTVRAQLPGYRHVTFADGTDPAAAVAGALTGLVPPGGLVAIEEEAMFFPPSVRAALERALAGRRWVDGTGVLAASRAVKSPLEVEDVRRAAAVSDAAMAAGIAASRPGVPEREVAAAVHEAMFAAGGQQPGFTPLIRPLWMLDQEHVSWGDRTVEGGLFIELSGCVRRYHAPLSRTVYTGPVPPAAVDAHAAATAGLEAALAALRPGTTTGDVYAAWRRGVAGTSAGAWPSRHHCGYLVGIGFPPSWVGGGQVLGIRAGGEVEIAAGMTFHLMSWVTEPAGHVVSDTVLVTPTGAELLTTTGRALVPAC